MRIDVRDLVFVYPRILDGILHSACCTCTVFEWGSNMVSICRTSISHNFCIDFCASCLRMLKFLKNNNAGTFTQYKTAAVFIERKGTFFRIIGWRKRSQCTESGNRTWTYGCLCSSGYHDICLSVLNAAERITDIIRTGRTGSYIIGTFSLQSQLDGDISCCHV